MLRLLCLNFVSMADLTLKQKREFAEILFTRQGLSGKEIADKVGTTEATISKWKKDGNWDNLKASLSVTKAEQLANINEQINELNAYIRKKPAGERFANSTESDTLSKLTASKRNLETEASIAETVDTFIAFNEWLRGVDVVKAKEFITLQDAYIKTLLK